MSYRYRCEQCRTTSPPHPTRAAAEAERHRHRARVHDGLIPDDDSIDETAAEDVGTDGLVLVLLAALLIAALIARIVN